MESVADLVIVGLNVMAGLAHTPGFGDEQRACHDTADPDTNASTVD